MRATEQASLWSASRRWSIPISECGEPLHPLSEIAELVDVRVTVPSRATYLAGRDIWARRRVVEMLAEMATNIAPSYRVVVVDAYRSIEYQQLRFELTLHEMRRRYGAAPDEEVRERTDRLVAIPDLDPQRPPPHSTGGAIDIMLESSGGDEIDYGSRISCFDDPEETDRHATTAAGLTPPQRQARDRLVAAAAEVGFANYPGEWWHFMFGDQEHALATGACIAIYGRADRVPGPHVG